MAAEVRVPGQVVALLANYCWVELAQAGPAGVTRLLCTRRTRLGKSGQTIAVGDRVWVEGIDWAAGRGAVAAVEPRDGLLERPAVANVARVVVVVALAEPELDPLQLTRFLITAEITGRPVQLVFAKADLVAPERMRAWCQRARDWGYDAVAVSARTGEGLPLLRQQLAQPGIAVLCGPSGVGKSSLLNGLCPGLDLRVAAVSGRLQRGRHTTRHVELFPLSPGALLADTPGFNRPRLPADPAALGPLFPEVRRRLSQASCRFSNCLHQGDPGCAVGSNWDRYPLYSQCLADLQQEHGRAGGQAAAARVEGPGLRLRSQGVEPRLAAGLRQPSRRRQRQQPLAADLDAAVEADLDQPAGTDPLSGGGVSRRGPAG